MHALNSFSNINLGFGEPVLDEFSELKQKEKLNKNRFIKASVIATSAILGAACGGLPGLLIAVTATCVSLAAWEIFKRFWVTYHQSPSQQRLSSKTLAEFAAATLSDVPGLGEETRADLRHIAHVEQAFQWKKRLIETAETSIELSPSYVGGEHFRELLEAVEKRMRERPNLKVYLIYSKELTDKQDEDYLSLLEKNYLNFKCLGFRIRPVLEPELASEENHVKLLIVDEKYFVMGGSGVTDSQTRGIAPENRSSENFFSRAFMPSSFCDTDIVGQGPIAKRMRLEFFKLYNIWEKKVTGQDINRFYVVDGKKGTNEDFEKPEGLFKAVKLKFFVGGPEHGEHNPITSAYLDMIKSAQKTIWIANLQFNPDRKIVEALKSQKDNNIYIRGIFNHTAFKGPLVIPSRVNYPLTTEVFEYNNTDTLYHKKVMVVDDQKTFIGSYNCSQKSAYYDHEIGVVISDEAFSASVKEALIEDTKQSCEYKPTFIVAKIHTFVGQLFGYIFNNFS